MGRISLVLDDEHLDRLESLSVDSGPYSSKSEAMRDILNEYEDLRNRCEELETENERLKNEKRTIIEQRESANDLRRYVEDELSYREAGLGTRVKWWLFGKEDS